MSKNQLIIQSNDGFGWRDIGVYDYNEFDLVNEHIDVIRTEWKDKKRKPKFRKFLRITVISEVLCEKIEI